MKHHQWLAVAPASQCALAAHPLLPVFGLASLPAFGFLFGGCGCPVLPEITSTVKTMQAQLSLDHPEAMLRLFLFRLLVGTHAVESHHPQKIQTTTMSRRNILAQITSTRTRPQDFLLADRGDLSDYWSQCENKNKMIQYSEAAINSEALFVKK